MRFSLMNVDNTRESGRIDGSWIQDCHGTLAEALERARATEAVNTGGGVKIDIAVVEGITIPETGCRRTDIERLDSEIKTKEDLKKSEVGISVKTLYETFGEQLEFHKIDTSEKGYYDIRGKFEEIICADGEICNVIGKRNGIVTLWGDDATFTLNEKEFEVAVFKEREKTKNPKQIER